MPKKSFLITFNQEYLIIFSMTDSPEFELFDITEEIDDDDICLLRDFLDVFELHDDDNDEADDWDFSLKTFWVSISVANLTDEFEETEDLWLK